jgi:hypothetical protein
VARSSCPDFRHPEPDSSFVRMCTIALSTLERCVLNLRSVGQTAEFPSLNNEPVAMFDSVERAVPAVDGRSREQEGKT